MIIIRSLAIYRTILLFLELRDKSQGYELSIELAE